MAPGEGTEGPQPAPVTAAPLWPGSYFGINVPVHLAEAPGPRAGGMALGGVGPVTLRSILREQSRSLGELGVSHQHPTPQFFLFNVIVFQSCWAHLAEFPEGSPEKSKRSRTTGGP